jgi:SAM-dependent methyltransferase
MQPEKIAFDRELSRGLVAYNEEVGYWWSHQTANSFHRYAHRNIAGFIHSSFSMHPGLIVDYACGAGNLLFRLHRHFPDSEIVGYDGSSLLLAMARGRLSRQRKTARQRIKFVETPLPNFELSRAIADLALFVFPNMVPCTAEEEESRWMYRLNPEDRRMAKVLAERYDSESARAEDDPKTICASLLRDRLISLNMRHLLKRNGMCIRVEYANVPRGQLTELELLRTGFEEGSLDQRVGGKVLDPWFRVVASRYHRSGVMEDVYHQSSDKNHKTGGYFITVLRAL